TVIRGDVNQIRIGARTNIQDGTIIHVSHHSPYNAAGYPTLIGTDVTIGHGTIIHACTIEKLCLIGMGACILDGVTIKKYGFVGAGAVISPNKIVGEAELWLGNPARLVRKLSDKEIESLHYSAQHYVKLKNRYLDLSAETTTTPSP
ncbi:MAG TPA: gamma carbonic anhydrase family protein, partial [Xylella fastidiosa subsp. multiplex]